MTTTPATQALLPVTPDPMDIPGDIWAEVDAVAEPFGNTTREYAQCVDRLRCALAQKIVLSRQAHSLPGDVGIGIDVAKRAEAIINANSEYMDGFDRGQIYFGRDAVLRMVLAALTPSALSGDAAGPWQKVGTFEPEPDALYLVQGTLRTSVKRGADIDADNSAAALIAPRIAALSGDAGEVETIRQQIINAPETADFMAGVPIEATHQRERWGASHDAGKTPFDWFWLVGYLAQKAASSAVAGDTDKALHHTISTAAALANWHAALAGIDTAMRPGIDPAALPSHQGAGE